MTSSSLPLDAKKMRKKSTAQERRFTRQGLIFASPWIIGFVGFTIFPIIMAFYYSFTDYDMFGDTNWIGWENYLDIFDDRYTGRAVKNTIYIALVGVPIGQIVALFLATLLNKKGVKGMPIFRTIFYLPTLVPAAACALLFLWVLNGKNGILNIALSSIGLKAPGWLTDPNWTKPALIIMDTWRCGGAMIIYLAALRSVPESFYEAASLDGANNTQKFWNITIPYIAPTIQFNGLMAMIGAFQYFVQAQIFSSITDYGSNAAAGGGPRNSMLFYCLHLYRKAFKQMEMGYACAMAVLLAIVVMIVSYLIMYFSEKKITYSVE